jgi:hypothetical protein
MGFCHVAQSGLKLLGSCHPPASCLLSNWDYRCVPLSSIFLDEQSKIQKLRNLLKLRLPSKSVAKFGF